MPGGKSVHLLSADGPDSETHEWAQKTTQQSMKPRVTFESGKTDAIRFMPNDRTMIDIVVRLVEISRKIQASLIHE